MLTLITFNVYAFRPSADKVVNLGTHGKTYPIIENNFYEWLMHKVKSNKENLPNIGEREVSEMLSKKMKVKGFDIPNCKKNKVKEIDPTYILEHNIKDANGNVLYSKGTIVNPFEYMDFKRKYFFLDVDNLSHVQLYKKLSASSEKNIQPLAVSGNLQKYYQTIKSMGINIPAGKPNKKIIKKMDITCVPSLAYQSGKILKVREYNIRGDDDAQE